MSTLALWNNYMESYDFLTDVDSYAKYLDDIVNALQITEGMRILDAGSGTGNLSLLLKARRASVLSCDFSSSALTIHREKDPTAEQMEASLEHPLDLPDCSFDRTCCASVLFALSKEGCHTAVREFHRVLRPKGRLVVTTVAPDQRHNNLITMHFKGLRRRFGLMQALLRGVAGLPALVKVLYYNRILFQLPDWQGFHRFTEEELIQLLTGAGFNFIKMQRSYGDCFFLAIAEKH